MKSKNLTIVFIIILFTIVMISIFKKKEDGSEKIFNIEIEKPKNQKFNEREFINYLNENAVAKFTNSNTKFFIDNLTVVDKNLYQNSESNYLWKDYNYIYISTNNSYSHFNQKKPLIIFNKENSKITVTKGFFVINYLNNLEDISIIEKKYQVEKISVIASDKIIIVRAKENSNLNEIYNHLKSNKSIQKIKLEVLDNIDNINK